MSLSVSPSSTPVSPDRQGEIDDAAIAALLTRPLSITAQLSHKQATPAECRFALIFAGADVVRILREIHEYQPALLHDRSVQYAACAASFTAFEFFARLEILPIEVVRAVVRNAKIELLHLLFNTMKTFCPHTLLDELVQGFFVEKDKDFLERFDPQSLLAQRVFMSNFPA